MLDDEAVDHHSEHGSRVDPDLVLRVGILAALYAIPAVAAVMKPVVDSDIWWHLRTGQWIFEHRALPGTDPFSSYGRDQPWIVYSWLFDVLVYGLYDRLGLVGILLYRVVLAFAIVVSVHAMVARRLANFVQAVALTALGFVALGPLLLTERSWLFSILFSVWTLDAVLGLRSGTGSRMVWGLPLVYALWSNIHIQFVYGLFFLALGCAGPLVDQCLGWGRRSVHADTAWSRGWWKLVVVAGLSAAAALCNPYGVGVYRQVLAFAGQSGVFTIIGEMLAMDFRQLACWSVLALTCGAAFALGRRKDLSAFDLLLLGCTSYFSFRSTRDLWFVVLAALAILSGAGTAGAVASVRDRFTRRPAVVAFLSFFLVTGFLFWKLDYREGRLAELVAKQYPAGVARVIEERGYEGPLYNDFGWGGYLIWRLPQLPVRIDGRANLHGDARIKRCNDTYFGAPGWDTDAELDAANVVIVPLGAPLVSLLRHDPRFTLAHEDGVAAVFVRRADGPVRRRL